MSTYEQIQMSIALSACISNLEEAHSWMLSKLF